MFYILDHNKVPVLSDEASAPVTVQKDVLPGRRVSTVFLSVQHGTDNQGRPVLFETMVFADGDWSGEFQCRYSTWDDALEGHKHVLNSVMLGLTEIPVPPTSVVALPQTEAEILSQMAKMLVLNKK